MGKFSEPQYFTAQGVSRGERPVTGVRRIDRLAQYRKQILAEQAAREEKLLRRVSGLQARQTTKPKEIKLTEEAAKAIAEAISGMLHR